MDLKLYCNEKRIIGEYGKDKGTPLKIQNPRFGVEV
jgi:hypothetical protein